MFSCEFCQISKSTFFTEHLWATASILREGRRLKQIEISIVSKLTKKKIKKEKCSWIFYFLLVVVILFLFRLNFLRRGLLFHYIHIFIMFKHAEFGKHAWIHTSKLKKHAHFKISSQDELFTPLFFLFFIPGWNFIPVFHPGTSFIPGWNLTCKHPLNIKFIYGLFHFRNILLFVNTLNITTQCFFS